jgi:hypothetical protein
MTEVGAPRVVDRLLSSATLQRRLLAAVWVLTPLSVLASGPMAFGIAMSGGGEHDLGDPGRPLLKVLVAFVAVAVGTGVAAWRIATRRPRTTGRRTGPILLAAISASMSGLIVAVFAVEILSL